MFPRDVGTLRHVLLQIFVFAFMLFICSSKSCVLCIAIVAVQLCLCISASQPIFSVTFSVNFDCLLVFCLLRALRDFVSCIDQLKAILRDCCGLFLAD